MRASRKQSTPNFPKNEHFLPSDTHTYPPDTHTYVRVLEVRNFRFSENLACFVFLKHALWDSLFYVITGEIILVLIQLHITLGNRNH